MSYTDADVERMAEAIAHIARAAMERESLDDVLGAVGFDLHLEREPDRSRPEWHVWVDKRHGAWGSTPSEAIRNAVANAKEGKEGLH